ncbi:MAG: rhamnogalacturonan acetylesterase [Chitinispirillaceae bacterium]|nr:rhamnogalacturonan acetylesterase [Chitinispirillaceae bacterium]
MKLVSVRLMVIFPLILSAAAGSPTYKFDFGSGLVASGYTQITPQTKYSSTLGYGIDKGNVSSVNKSGSDALKDDYLTTSDEFLFSVNVSQGNYDVTVIFGDANASTSTTVKAENRRLLFDRVTTSAGGFVSKTITVNRREVKSTDGSVTMSIKDRELTYFTWDKVLTLRFSGKKPAICGVEIIKNDNVKTLFLCGNSTVVDQMDAPWCSWGQMIPCFFKPGVTVANYAESGLTAGGFLSMRRLDKIMAEAKSGDYVFVEFGHNDQKNSTDVANYANNLKTFRDKIKAKGAIPVFVTPTARQGENDPNTSIGGLAKKMRETAVSLDVTCIDLNQMVIDLHKALGSNTQYLYMYTEGDQTHFCEYGGYELARCVAKGIEEKFPLLKSSFISEYTTFKPSQPDPLDYLTRDKDPVAIDVLAKTGAASGLHIAFNARAYSITVNGPGDGTRVEMYSINGKRVFRSTIRSDLNAVVVSLPVSKLNRGCYLVRAVRGNEELVRKMDVY